MTLTSKKLAAAVLAITVAMSLSACSNWSKRDRNTAIGAGAGPKLDVIQRNGFRAGSKQEHRQEAEHETRNTKHGTSFLHALIFP